MRRTRLIGQLGCFSQGGFANWGRGWVRRSDGPFGTGGLPRWVGRDDVAYTAYTYARDHRARI